MDIVEIDYFFYGCVGHSLTAKEDKVWKRSVTNDNGCLKLHIEVDIGPKIYKDDRYLQDVSVGNVSITANQMVRELKNKMRRKNEPA